MKIKYLTVLLTLILFQHINAQNDNDGWFWQYPKPQGNALRDIYVFDSTTAIAVGDLGTVIKTTDSGENWDVQHHAGGIDIDLYSVHFTDELNGWACGGIQVSLHRNGLIKTDDGGKTWEEVRTGKDSISFSSVYFINTDTGFVVGEKGVVLKTTDAGNTWSFSSLYVWDALPKLNKVIFTDENNGWIIGSEFYGNVLFRTFDCGNTWFRVFGINKNVFSMVDLQFIDKNNGFIIGLYGELLKTTNGGNTWQFSELPPQPGSYYSVYFTDSLTGWVVGGGYYAFILKTIDGGENWIEVANNNTEMMHHFYKIRFADKNNGWIIGQFGMIYRTINAGKKWATQREEKYSLSSIFFADENAGWAVGEKGIILHTEDGGNSWVKQYQNDSLLLNSVYAIDNQNVFTVGSVIKGLSVYDRIGIMFRTNNGGKMWVRQNFDTLYGFNSVAFLNDSIGWISESQGTILKTVNKGALWVKTAFYSSMNWFTGKIQFVNQDIGWIGSSLKTTNGGKDWIKQNIPVLSFPKSYFINKDIGYLVGNSTGENNIFKTSDGGRNWFPIGKTYPGYYFDVYFANQLVGWIAGVNYSGQKSVVKTTDGGNTWLGQDIPSETLTDIFFINENTGWIVGNGIFKTVNGGGVVSVKDDKEIDKNTPKEIELNQNYPNPFNPNTVIVYSINHFQHVRLEIFNIIGQEIEILVDEEQSSGNYKINWYPKNISSGVYFYRLTTETGVITKKMLLIR